MINFKDKRVTVMGLGLHGGGVAVVNWLIKHGAKVTVTDLKGKKELKPSLGKLVVKRYSDRAIKLALGRHWEADFKTADLIIQNPGVPRESKYLEIAKKSGVPIENDASLFFKHCPASIIGVTGTRGKSTTATLIYEILKTRVAAEFIRGPEGAIPESRLRVGENKFLAYAGMYKKVWLAGLPQKPMLGILDQVKPNDIVVLEISSWQLEILGQHKLSPYVAVFTNIYPDHLNRYPDMPAYIKAKKNIILWQDQDDFSVLNLDNPETKKIGQQVISQRFWFSKKYFKEENGCFTRGKWIYLREKGKETKVASLSDIKLFGWHNLENVLAAIAATASFSISPKNIKSVLSDFSGLPGRLELIKEKLGIKYVNDTTATTPDATMAALRLAKKKNVILIAGGDTKNISEVKYKKLAKVIKKNCKAVILFSGQGSSQIKKQLKSFKPLVFGVTNMTEAVSLAQSFSRAKDTILLSPASASFNLFINEFDRGDQFEKVIKEVGGRR